jgi:hypothetical protein
MIELMNVVQAMDPKIIEAQLRAKGVKSCNVKAFLNFIADKINGEHVKAGAFWSAGGAAKIIGVSKRQFYNMRAAAVTLKFATVETRIAPTTGERDKPSVLRLTTEILRYVDANLFERITGRPWTTDETGELRAWVNLLHTPCEQGARGECTGCIGCVHSVHGGSELGAAEPEYKPELGSEGEQEMDEESSGPSQGSRLKFEPEEV